MGGVNQYVPSRESPGLNAIGAIANALQAAHAYYGIDTQKQQQKLQQLQIAQQEAAQSPTSDYSKVRQASTKAGIEQLESGGYLPKQEGSALLQSIAGQSGESLDKLSETNLPLKLAIAKMQAQAMANRYMGIVGTKQDDQSQHAGDVFDKNPQITQFSNQAFSIQRGLHTLQGQPTNKVAMEVMQDFANAISQGKGASNYKLQSIETPTLEGLGADMKSFVQSNPDQPAPPKVIQYLNTQGQRLLGAYKGEIGMQADALMRGRRFSHNPDAQQVLQDKHDYYKSGAWLNDAQQSLAPQTTGMNQGAGMPESHPQDTVAVQWAKSNPNDPRAAKILQLNGG